jgi:hypothetical protein
MALHFNFKLKFKFKFGRYPEQEPEYLQVQVDLPLVADPGPSDLNLRGPRVVRTRTQPGCSTLHAGQLLRYRQSSRAQHTQATTAAASYEPRYPLLTGRALAARVYPSHWQLKRRYCAVARPSLSESPGPRPGKDAHIQLRTFPKRPRRRRAGGVSRCPGSEGQSTTK